MKLLSMLQINVFVFESYIYLYIQIQPRLVAVFYVFNVILGYQEQLSAVRLMTS